MKRFGFILGIVSISLFATNHALAGSHSLINDDGSWNDADPNGEYGDPANPPGKADVTIQVGAAQPPTPTTTDGAEKPKLTADTSTDSNPPGDAWKALAEKGFKTYADLVKFAKDKSIDGATDSDARKERAKELRELAKKLDFSQITALQKDIETRYADNTEQRAAVLKLLNDVRLVRGAQQAGNWLSDMINAGGGGGGNATAVASSINPKTVEANFVTEIVGPPQPPANATASSTTEPSETPSTSTSTALSKLSDLASNSLDWMKAKLGLNSSASDLASGDKTPLDPPTPPSKGVASTFDSTASNKSTHSAEPTEEAPEEEESPIANLSPTHTATIPTGASATTPATNSVTVPANVTAANPPANLPATLTANAAPIQPASSTPALQPVPPPAAPTAWFSPTLGAVATNNGLSIDGNFFAPPGASTTASASSFGSTATAGAIAGVSAGGRELVAANPGGVDGSATNSSQRLEAMIQAGAFTDGAAGVRPASYADAGGGFGRTAAGTLLASLRTNSPPAESLYVPTTANASGANSAGGSNSVTAPSLASMTWPDTTVRQASAYGGATYDDSSRNVAGRTISMVSATSENEAPDFSNRGSAGSATSATVASTEPAALPESVTAQVAATAIAQGPVVDETEEVNPMHPKSLNQERVRRAKQQVAGAYNVPVILQGKDALLAAKNPFANL